MYKSRKLKKHRSLCLSLNLLSGLLAISNCPTIYAQDVKVGVIEEHFNPYSRHVRSRLSESSDFAYENQDIIEIVNNASNPKLGNHHGNCVISKIIEIAPKIKLRVIDFENESCLRDISNVDEKLAMAIKLAVRSGAKIINISRRLTLGENLDGEISQHVKEALLEARDAGICIIKSAGNDRECLGQTPYTSSLLNLLEEMNGYMVMVVALDRDLNDLAWRFSNLAGLSPISSKYVIAAPGEAIVANGAGDKPIIMSGTSMAAPFVTGHVAHIMEMCKLSSYEALKCILDSAEIENDFQRRILGRGIVNMENALQLAKERAAEKENSTPKSNNEKPSFAWDWGIELEPSAHVIAHFEAIKSKKSRTNEQTR